MLTESEMESGTISKRGIEIVRGSGAHIWDANGKRYLDMGASYGVCNVGHCHPRVVSAITEQANQLVHISSSYDNPTRRELMERLLEMTPGTGGRVFLSNSGTEAVEAAVKYAVHITGRTGMVAAKRAFHGRTLASLSLTWGPNHRKGFEDLLPRTTFVTYGDPEPLEEAITKDTAALVLEAVQGEGGVHVPPEDYLEAAADLCHDKGALLVVDEVQTGLGRTGRNLAVEHSNLIPDILCLGKALGGGMPIAATLLREGLGPVARGTHGSTFGGNPLACAAANATLSVLEDEGLAARAEDLGHRFIRGLREVESPKVREVRGVGLMVGLELKMNAGPYLRALMERGIAAIPSGATVIRFLPTLVIGEEDIDDTLAAVREVLGSEQPGGANPGS
jgi:acetylornithine/LysW-gamma-L-lysine aminotransferase